MQLITVASSAPKVAEEERFDQTAQTLANLIMHCNAFSGAGISTSAGRFNFNTWTSTILRSNLTWVEEIPEFCD